MSQTSSAVNAPIHANRAHPSKADLPPLVLIVEDDKDTRELYRYLLEVKGLRVMEAEDGEQAVFMAQAAHPDLILMDTSLPYMDGISATLRIRTLEGLRNVPIVFLSGHAQPQARATALASGGNEYLIKPVDPTDFESAVERQLKLTSSSLSFSWIHEGNSYE